MNDHPTPARWEMFETLQTYWPWPNQRTMTLAKSTYKRLDPRFSIVQIVIMAAAIVTIVNVVMAAVVEPQLSWSKPLPWS